MAPHQIIKKYSKISAQNIFDITKWLPFDTYIKGNQLWLLAVEPSFIFVVSNPTKCEQLGMTHLVRCAVSIT